MFPFSLLSRKNRAHPQQSRAQQPRRSARGRRRATTLIETALCMTFVLLPVTLGAFQMAMVFITSHSLQQITRESARWAAVHYNEDTFNNGVDQGDTAGDPQSMLHYVRGQAAANGIPWSDISGGLINKIPGKAGEAGGSVVITPDDSQRISGKPLTITITYPMRQRSFLGALFFKSDDGKKLAPLQFGFLKSNWVEASTTLLE